MKKQLLIFCFTFLVGCTSYESAKNESRATGLTVKDIVKNADFSVGILVPQNSGIAFVKYKSYSVANDTMYVTDEEVMKDTLKREEIIAKYFIAKEKITRLKEAVAKTDSIGQQTNLCFDIIFGRTRFFMFFNDNGRKKDGFIANIYRKEIFDIIDILNEIPPDGYIVGYDKNELIQEEIDCNKKRLHNSTNIR